MSDLSFRFRVITPQKITEKDITHIRLKDKTGFFGIMRGHTDFLTVLEPSLCYYTDANGKEFFLAVDGGVLAVKKGVVSLTSRGVYESTDTGALIEIIETAILKRDEAEIVLRGMLEGIERSFIEKSLVLIKRRT